MIALLSDIHGNADAFEKVLEDARKCGADTYILLGDYIFDMPDSCRVTDMISTLPNAYVLAGNKEGYLNDSALWESTQAGELWQFAVLFETYRSLSDGQKKYLMGLPKVITLRLPSGHVLMAAHTLNEFIKYSRSRFSSSGQFARDMRSSPFTHDDYLKDMKLYCEENLSDQIASLPADIVAFGHSHLQGYALVKNRCLVNPGSVGMPLDVDNRAAYTLIEDSPSGITVHERRVEYDVEAALTRAVRSECYRKGEIWSKMVHCALRTGRDDVFMNFFEIARSISQRKKENGRYMSNETFAEAFERLRVKENI